MKCKNCREEIKISTVSGYPVPVHVHGHGKIFCLTKQGQTIGTMATPEEEK